MLVEMMPTVAAPADGTSRIAMSLIAVAKLSRCLLAIRLAEIGLFNGQDELLLALKENEPQSVSGLAEIMAVRPSTVSKSVDRLVAQTLLERGSAADKRTTMIILTAAGAEKRSEVVALHARLEAEFGNALASDSTAALTDNENTLRKMLRRLR